MLGNLFQQLYTFVDALIVGRCVSADALAALGATEWLTFIMFGVTSGIMQGCSVVVAGYFGKKQTDLLKKAIFSGYFIAAVGAICLTAAGQVMIYPGLRLLRTPDEILGMSRQEISIVAINIENTGIAGTEFCVL